LYNFNVQVHSFLNPKMLAILNLGRWGPIPFFTVTVTV